eukprot:TRINITY_DN4445_c0_g1_i3.p1 TRINITY_DN4445_c0_g1~~TRINITY_DN4445_c0_g1_i3.p1  ORF type:complete len:104 (+),score=11.58 TRINITY_DN4445_c0_g1_i3:115-426(+)
MKELLSSRKVRSIEEVLSSSSTSREFFTMEAHSAEGNVTSNLYVYTILASGFCFVLFLFLLFFLKRKKKKKKKEEEEEKVLTMCTPSLPVVFVLFCFCFCCSF